MASAALFVLSSAWEGFGNVLVEVLAAGAPVVATDCKSGPREILEAVRRGRLVQVGDVEALARKMLASLDEKVEPASAAALRIFTMDYVVDEYTALIQAILMGRIEGNRDCQ